ncbi:tRNA (adenine(22)-N(1))-methyltransferase TrmK [Gracilibacillus sp. S3-1-1]|uniref:tRNA (Adenine(22)-N(1))-methyltransferase TrmK n=1 Tax=Gracilibacillus pellucidus TaxID=3095368 RepID=A0ACC6M4Z8_9BACI|nr:tRNA (adenine(22)-N(1))-methyltransferase TrmK [Gracilibacillus sp. S3-1-1]MDX8045963.1 tRNA (adenine(22)-N(1))-methyltransferase TrmK [Gracilibacillus sp. S3-1-1]
MLSKRLEQLAKYLKQPIQFADIGSDHAFLPCYVCLENPTATAIAGEVNQGPFERAKQTVVEHELTDRIEVRKGNGLDVLTKDEVNQITIAGMGGKLICTILDEGKEKLSSVKRLILQPNIDAQLVRKWLNDHQYEVVAEEIISEDGYTYEIIVGDHQANTTNLSEKELLFGPFLLQEQSTVFMDKWTSEKEKRIKLIDQMKKATSIPEEKIDRLKEEITWIEEVIQHDNR